MIRGIIFDFDDTLGNREDYAYKLFTEIISKYCTNELLRESIVQHCMIWDQNGNESKKYVQDMLRSVYTINLNMNLDTYWDDHLWCKSENKIVGKVENKNVGKPTKLFST